MDDVLHHCGGAYRKISSESRKKIVLENLKNEIALSPMNNDLKKAKLTLMMDGGWDQRASGKASTVPLDVTCLSELGQTKWWH